MRKLGWFFYIFIFVYVCFASLNIEAVLRVVVNGQVKGDFIVSITPDKDILVTEDFLRSIGLKKPFRAKKKTGLISLNSIKDLNFSVNEKKALLEITVDPRLLTPTNVAIKRKREIHELEYLKDNAFYLNYYLRYYADDHLNNETFNGNFEAALRLEELLFYSDLSYAKSESVNSLHRLSSSITIDKPDKLHRVVIGDFSATSGELGSNLLLGGVKIERNFSLNPYLLRYPNLGIEGVLETPSTVEVYLNGALYQRLELPPGPFRIENLPAMPGSGKITLIIRDALGKETVIERPFYIPSRMLGQGVTEYSLAFGFRREDIGKENFHYGRAALLGYMRRGLTDYLTMGLRAEVDDEIANAGVEATTSLFSKAEMRFSTALSQKEGEAGYAGSLGINIPTQKRISLGFTLRKFSKEYTDLLETNNSSLNWAVRVSFSVGPQGSISSVFSWNKNHDNSKTKALSIHYHRPFLKVGNIFLTFQRQWLTSKTEDIFTFGILLPLGKSRYASLQHTSRVGQQNSTLSLSKNPPRGPGVGYRLQVNRNQHDSSGEWRGYGRVEYHHEFGHLIGEYQKTENLGSISLGARGALVVAGGEVHPSAPIYDGFALVDTGLKGAKVRLGGQFMGETSESGKLVVPGLVSYYDNPISISANDLPMEFTLKESTKHVAPYYRSGGIVKFEIGRLNAVEGKIFWIEKEKKVPVEFAGLDINVEGKKIESVTGEKGFFYIEGLKSGRYPAHIFKDGKECRFTLFVPESKEPFINVGDIVCK
ncbi:fimbria/pilus outer membrane usher protein [Nitratiruptor tergarcus]|uniref:Outer membrane usher protein FimD/PapC n=1 Tax=Nitratiruptor tergarcus DSM 16512 TaxID=1069081 RepID=A0A1W1WRE0_9BACT|nr:fimbria/pilus outer membrane usher protein [Nitratiruptor tergarcus]SMC08816.1 Outer membrane usher protein FimD/PapC [Nitratiruptor tergarcus DSM 16512]